MTRTDGCSIHLPCPGNPIQSCGCKQGSDKPLNPLLADVGGTYYSHQYESEKDLLASGIFLSGNYTTKDNNETKYYDLWETLCPTGWKYYNESCLKISDQVLDFNASKVGCPVGNMYRNTYFGFWTRLSFGIAGDEIWGEKKDNVCLTSNGVKNSCEKLLKFACSIPSELKKG